MSYPGQLRLLGGPGQSIFVGKRSPLNFAKHVGDQSAVDLNRRTLSRQLGCSIQWLTQVHGTTVIEATQRSVDNLNLNTDPVADAVVTVESRIALAIMTADCLPVMFADRQSRLIGAAHAGWRGLADGVIESTLKIFNEKGIHGSEIAAFIGPSIGATAFEVGDEVRQCFLEAARPNEIAATQAAFVRTTVGRWLANLPSLAALRMRRFGVLFDQPRPECTYSDPANYFSYRYFCHHPQAIDGRQVTLIWLDR
jgi:polyphenol oxidase